MAYFPPEKVFHAILCAQRAAGPVPVSGGDAPMAFLLRGWRAACRRCHTALPRWVIERRLVAFAARQRKAPLVAACRRCHTALPRWVIERRLVAFAARQRKAPLVQRGDSMAQPCRGDCEAKEIHLARFCCLARERSMGVAARHYMYSKKASRALFT